MPTTIDRPPLATNFGGGGAFGFGFDMGVAVGLRRAGIDVSRHPMIGTSAGSHTVAALRLGLDFHEVCDTWERHLAEHPARWWADGHAFADRVYGAASVDGVRGVAVPVRGRKRELLGSDGYAIVDIVAASSAAVPVVRPHRIDGRWFVDGGVISLASGDLTPGASFMLLVTPFGRDGQGIAGRIGERQAGREIRAWVARHGGDVLHVVPTDEMVRIGGKRVRDIVDIRIGREVFPLALEYGERVAGVLREMRPDLFG